MRSGSVTEPRLMSHALNGELNVLSTDSSAPAVCAMPAIVAMPDTLSVGLAGVSMCTSFVFGRIASRTFCGDVGRVGEDRVVAAVQHGRERGRQRRHSAGERLRVTGAIPTVDSLSYKEPSR